MTYLAVWQDDIGGLEILAFTSAESRSAWRKEEPYAYIYEDMDIEETK